MNIIKLVLNRTNNVSDISNSQYFPTNPVLFGLGEKEIDKTIATK